MHDDRYTRFSLYSITCYARLLVMHDYSLRTITPYARLLVMHDYSLCTITRYARLLVMHDYSLCTITRYARLLVLHDHSLCKNELGVQMLLHSKVFPTTQVPTSSKCNQQIGFCNFAENSNYTQLLPRKTLIDNFTNRYTINLFTIFTNLYTRLLVISLYTITRYIVITINHQRFTRLIIIALHNYSLS